MPRKYIATAAPSGATSPRPRAMAAQRPAADLRAERELLVREPREDQEADRAEREPHGAERLQRPVQEAHQELDPQEIEQHAEGAVDAVLRHAAGARMVAHRYLDDVR